MATATSFEYLLSASLYIMRGLIYYLTWSNSHLLLLYIFYRWDKWSRELNLGVCGERVVFKSWQRENKKTNTLNWPPYNLLIQALPAPAVMETSLIFLNNAFIIWLSIPKPGLQNLEDTSQPQIQDSSKSGPIHPVIPLVSNLPTQLFFWVPILC